MGNTIFANTSYRAKASDKIQRKYTGARRQDPHMVPHVVVPPTNLFSFIFLFLIYFAWKIYGNTDKQVF